MVPVENLNGRKKVEEGDLCERRNGLDANLKYLLFCILKTINVVSFIIIVLYLIILCRQRS